MSHDVAVSELRSSQPESPLRAVVVVYYQRCPVFGPSIKLLSCITSAKPSPAHTRDGDLARPRARTPKSSLGLASLPAGMHPRVAWRASHAAPRAGVRAMARESCGAGPDSLTYRINATRTQSAPRACGILDTDSAHRRRVPPRSDARFVCSVEYGVRDPDSRGPGG